MGRFDNRAIDLFYFIYFILHAIATLLIDIQAIYFAEDYSPHFIRQLFIFARKNDPMLTNATNYPSFIWFQTFIILEILFQLPVFYLGAVGLYRNSKSIYPLLIIYGASASTTTLACLTTIYSTPSNSDQLLTLIPSYLPFFVIPLGMSIDFAFRCTKIIRESTSIGTKKRI